MNLASIPPDERGVSFHRWLLADITRQCAEWYKAAPPTEDAPLSKKAIWNPRDSYGWKSI